MKPKNKFQKKIAGYSKKLPEITESQIKWARVHCFDHIAHRTKKNVTTCLDCGHTWTMKRPNKSNVYETECPHCHTKLKIINTRQRVFRQTEYFCIPTTFNGFQILRFFYFYSYRKVGQPASYFQKEVVQRWIAPNGKYATLAILRVICYYVDKWQWNKILEIRPERTWYEITPTQIYPRKNVINEIKRNGFDGKFHNIAPFELFRAILTNKQAETLLKSGQIAILRHFIVNDLNKIGEYWDSIKICIRNNYFIENGSMWCDLINLLIFFGKDIHNAKYVCPNNLEYEHNLLVEKKKQWQERENIRQMREKAMKNEEYYRKLKGQFFGLKFSDETIQISVLESVDAFYEEGKAMRHCLFINEYYLKPESLILSARIDNRRIETIEVSLKTMKVIQSRGVCNSNTEYHKRIISLVNKNMRQIQKRLSA